MKYPKEVVAEWIRMINEQPSKPLSEWENSFMLSITDEFERTGYLTGPQLDKLEDIYTHKT